MTDDRFIGRTISHYQILEKLGEGGMGVVYRALDSHLDRLVAIKVLRSEMITDAESKRRFVQEAKAASSLNHPNIITIYDIGNADGVDFIAMEYVAGKTLHQLIRERPLPPGAVVKYSIQIADTLAVAHAAGIVHRDLKPSNVMVTEKSVVKVLDFGLAKLVERPERIVEDAETMPGTAVGIILGTTSYMSPEQAAGGRVDGRSDIFSFGSVLYEMVCGRRSFCGETQELTVSAILHRQPKPVREIVGEVPPEIERIITRCLQKDPERRFQHAGDLKLTLEEIVQELQSGSLDVPAVTPPPAWEPGRPLSRARFAAGLGIGLLLGAAVAGCVWWLARRPAPTGESVLTRLTSDSGLSAYPALSSDGKLLAYASDRSGEGNLDIWVQQIGGGQPIRLTDHEADDYEAVFSPDGTRIAFRSEREGAGIYVVPALGGEARLVGPQGHRPRFSPDGNRITYWVGGIGAPAVSTLTRSYVAPVAGGEPRQVHPEFASARDPIWTPDGKHLLFLGIRETNVPREQGLDWWLASLDQGAGVRTGAFAVFRAQGLEPPPEEYAIAPGMFVPGTEDVVFSAGLGDSANLWRIAVPSGTGKVAGRARRVTIGTGLEVQPSVATGPSGRLRLAFSSLTFNADIWSLPIDGNHGKVRGNVERLTREVSFEAYPSLSEDGKKLALISSRLGTWDAWVRDLEDRSETIITALRTRELQPKISGDGASVAYWAEESGKRATYLVGSRGGVPQKICDCGPPTHISADGQKVLLESSTRAGDVILADLGSGRQAIILPTKKHPDYASYAARFSPDQRWIGFHARTGNPVARQVFIVPFQNGAVSQDQEWISVTDGSAMDREIYWSPDGNLLYFLSDREGFRCVWAQRLDPQTKRPAGLAFPVSHFHHAQRSLTGVGGSPGAVGMAVSRDRMVFALGELAGNIWMVEESTKLGRPAGP